MIAIPRLRALGATLGMTFRSRFPVPGPRVAHLILLTAAFAACSMNDTIVSASAFVALPFIAASSFATSANVERSTFRIFGFVG